jgi:hypothetical protein
MIEMPISDKIYSKCSILELECPRVLWTTKSNSVNNSKYFTDIQSKDTRKHRHESAFKASIHILVSLTQPDNKSYEEIAEDFDNNFEFVAVWIDYMTKLNWLYKTGDKWVATEEGKRWIQNYADRAYSF